MVLDYNEERNFNIFKSILILSLLFISQGKGGYGAVVYTGIGGTWSSTQG